MAAALMITCVRALHPIELGWDAATQLEAATRLAGGLGLTSTFFSRPSADILEGVVSQSLTWWPPGFTVLMAGLSAMGVPLVIALKVVYGMTTVLGWAAWARIGELFLARPLRLLGRPWPLQLIFAVLLPIFYTPPWVGTDIFLWAGVPAVLWSVSRGLNDPSPLWPGLGGFLFGVLACFRYAALFLAPCAFGVAALGTWPDRRRLGRNTLLFVAGALPLLLAVMAYNRGPRDTGGLPSYMGSATAAATSSDVVARLLPQIGALTALPQSPVVAALGARLSGLAGGAALGGAVCLAGLAVLALAVARLPEPSPLRALALGLSLIPLMIAGMLAVSSLRYPFPFLATPRYYLPVGPSFLFLVYWLASSSRSKPVAIVLTAALLVWAGFDVLRRPLVRNESDRQLLAVAVLGFPPLGGSGAGLIVPEATAARAGRELLAREPQAIFFVRTESYPFWALDGAGRFRPLPKVDFWRTAFASAPVRVYIALPLDPESSRLPLGEPPPSDFSGLPGLRTVAAFPADRVKIVASDVPSGYRFCNALPGLVCE